DLLEAITDPPPVPAITASSPAPTRTGDGFTRFDRTAAGVRGYLQSRGVTVVKERAKGDSTILDLAACPVTGVEANGTEISVMVASSGSIAFRNLHNRGTGLGWIDVREAMEPGYRAHIEHIRNAATNDTPVRSESEVSASEQWDLPSRLQPAATPLSLTGVFPPALGGIRDYIHAVAEAIQMPADVPAMLMHPAVGLSMSQVVCVELNESWRQSPVHYNAVLMEPGNRKSDAFSLLLAPIHQWEQEAVIKAKPKIAAQHVEIKATQRQIERLLDLASGKVGPRKNSGEPSGDDAKAAAVRLQEELAQVKIIHEPQFITGDITSEDLARVLEANQERLGVFSDESEAIDIMLGRYSDQPNFQLYNKAYDGSSHRINRVGRPSIALRRPLLSVGFAIQPEAVRDLMANRKAKGTGLLARFGMSLPDSCLGARKINPPAIPPVLSTMWANALQNLLAMKIPEDGKPIVVELSPKARAAFDDFRARIESELAWCGEFAAYGLQDWGGKLCGKVARTALTLHGMLFGVGAISSLSEPISLETMLAAINWAPYLAAHMKAVMSFVGLDENHVTGRRVLAWIARSGLDRFSANECFTHIRNARITTTDEVAPALELLTTAGYLRPLRRNDPPRRGRPASTEYIVNPRWDRRTP
ncbi:MAG: DUF3987 domain-containing protein, partial [Phycisphaerae bacterium]|nr:DUF3987 domain-containing protein [Phycisphaerae bacterium]